MTPSTPLTSTPTPASAQAFLAARDQLLSLRGDPAAASAQFRWPQLDPLQLGAGPLRRAWPVATTPPALWIVDEDGRPRSALALRSCRAAPNQVANFLRAPGRAARRPRAADAGQRAGAVGDDAGLHQARRGADSDDHAAHAGRPARPHRTWRACNTWWRAQRRCPSSRHQRARSRASCVGGSRRRAGATSQTRASTPADLHPAGQRRRPPTRCCCTSPRAPPPSPSWCCTPTRATRSATCRTMYWIGLQPGDVHLNISSPGWAKHAWSCFFAPWNAGACVFIYNYAAFQRAGPAGGAGALPRDQPVRAAHGVAHADPGRPGRVPRPAGAARTDRRRRAAEPGNHRTGAARPGASRCATASARPRPPRRSATRRASR